MTAQFSDRFFYKGNEYALVEINGSGFFDPVQYGLTPVSWCTACWRGYLATYEIHNDKLHLRTLDVCLSDCDAWQDNNGEAQKVAAPVLSNCSPIDITGHEFDLSEE